MKADKWQPSKPFDPKKGGKSVFQENKHYPIENIQLIKKDKENIDLIQKTAKVNSEIRYKIVSEYLQNYDNLLKTDPNQINYLDIYKNENGTIMKFFTDVMHDDDLFSIENMKKNYLIGNIVVVQRLKRKKNKIAYANYLNEYMNPYYATLNQIKPIKENIQIAKEIDDIRNYSGSERDIYVSRQLAWYDVYGISNKEKFTEEELDKNLAN